MQNRAFWTALALVMCDSAIGVMSSIYSYTIVLSHYPANWLIYYIILATLGGVLFRKFGLTFLSKNHKKSTLKQYAFFIFLSLVSCWVMYSALKDTLYSIPLIVTVVNSSTAALATILCWSTISLAFGMRDYKIVARYANQASFASSIIFSFIVPLLVLFFSNIALLVFIALLFILCYLLIYLLPISEDPTPKVEKSPTTKKVKYPLYRYMMCYAIVVASIVAITQYSMRIEAAQNYTHEQLSSFFGYFSGITNLLGLIISTTTGTVLKHFGINGLLYFVPAVSFLGAMVSIIHPSLAGVLFLGSLKNTFYYSYYSYASEVVLNIFPPATRFIAKTNIKSTSNLISMCILVLITFNAPKVQQILLWLPILSGAAIFAALKIRKYYRVTLQQESSFKRYRILDEINHTTIPIFSEIGLQSIQSSDVYTVIYGLDLLNKLPLPQLPQKLYGLVHHPDESIRLTAINLIISKNTPAALDYLITQFKQETNLYIQFTLIEYIARKNILTAVTISQLCSNTSLGNMIKNLTLTYVPEYKAQGLLALKELCQHPDPVIRELTASLIGTFKITELSGALATLIADPNPLVSDEAVRAAAEINLLSLVPQITTALITRKKNYAPHYALVALGPSVLPYLSSQVFHTRTCKTVAKTIAAIAGTEAEDTLIAIAKQGSIYCRNVIAKYANERACVQAISPEFKKQAHILAEEECIIIISLRNFLTKQPDHALQREIELRIESAKIRFLHWLAIATRPILINKLISSLVQLGTSQSQQILDKAIELLEIYINDKKTRTFISYIFENQPLDESTLTAPNYSDTWLEQIMNSSTIQSKEQSPLLSVIFELRAIRLFKDLPAELLLALAEEVEYRSFNAAELIFSKDDQADGLYCVSQGEVNISRDQKAVTTIKEHGFFGELALLDESYRVASATAKTNCSLIFIEKDVFNRIADDVPDVLRIVLKVILEYLRKNLEHGL
jgi:hypothetical protein